MKEIVNNWKHSRLPYGGRMATRQRYFPETGLVIEDIVLETVLELEIPERLPRRW